MAVDVLQEREQAHLLLDTLSNEKVLVVRNLLELLVEPLSLTLSLAEMDDEHLGPETIAALQRADRSFEAGQGMSHEDFLAELKVGAA